MSRHKKANLAFELPVSYSYPMKKHVLLKSILSAILIILFPLNSFAFNFTVNGVNLKKTIKPFKEIKLNNVVTQSLDFSCGAAGLSTLLNYYLNDPVEEREIINTLLKSVPLEKIIERRGFSLLDLKHFAQEKGFNVVGYKMDIESLRRLNQPVLVPISFKKYQHFVVVKAVMADRVFIADPAAGNVSMKIDKFQSLWTNGIVLSIRSKKKNAHYALKVKKNDFLIADHKSLERIINRSAVRIAIYPNEF